MHSIIIILYF